LVKEKRQQPIVLSRDDYFHIASNTEALFHLHNATIVSSDHVHSIDATDSNSHGILILRAVDPVTHVSHAVAYAVVSSKAERITTAVWHYVVGAAVALYGLDGLSPEILLHDMVQHDAWAFLAACPSGRTHRYCLVRAGV
jgi:hypothetical protein